MKRYMKNIFRCRMNTEWFSMKPINTGKCVIDAMKIGAGTHCNSKYTKAARGRAAILKRHEDVVRQAKLIQAMQVGILHGKVEPDHPERNPARQEVTNVVKPGERRQQAVIRKGEGEMVPKCTSWRVPRLRRRLKATQRWAIEGEASAGSSGFQATACWT